MLPTRSFREPKKDPGAEPEPPTNVERAAMAEAPGAEHKLREAPPVAGMAEGGHEHAGSARAEGETEGHTAARKAVVEAFEAGGGTCGHGCVTAVAGVGERTVRDVMRDEGLVARAARKRRRHSPCAGETTEAPGNLPRDERGEHRLRADGPDEPWVADVTEFRVPAGKACLSPVVGCFDGMPPSWSIPASPDAETAGSSPLGACERLVEGDRPRIRSDRGRRCRWPGWVRTCDESGPVRSTSRKGRGPDNARCEGLCA